MAKKKKLPQKPQRKATTSAPRQKITPLFNSPMWWLDKKFRLPLLGILALTFMVYIPILNGEKELTNWDDPSYVTENPHIFELDGKSVSYMFQEPIAFNYHPLTMLSLAINYQVSGLNPQSYFWVNLILHLLSLIHI